MIKKGLLSFALACTFLNSFTAQNERVLRLKADSVNKIWEKSRKTLGKEIITFIRVFMPLTPADAQAILKQFESSGQEISVELLQLHTKLKNTFKDTIKKATPAQMERIKVAFTRLVQQISSSLAGPLLDEVKKTLDNEASDEV